MSELQYEVNPLENPAILKKAFEDYEVVPKWRSIGTKGATGLTKEPEDTLAYIHKNERVLSESENNEYNRRMANNGLDKNHEDTVKLINGVNMLIAEVKKGTEINKRTYDVIVANA